MRKKKWVGNIQMVKDNLKEIIEGNKFLKKLKRD